MNNEAYGTIICLAAAAAGGASGCRKADPSSSPAPSASATTVASAPGSASAAPAPAAPSARYSLAEKQRYQGLLDKCNGNDVAACEAVCDEFDPQGCAAGASLMLEGKVPDDPARRAKLNEKGCTRGAWKSCNQLATAYRKGDGVRVDTQRAVALYTKSCDAGDAGGCEHLGVMYTTGDGVPVDGAKVVEYYEKGCAARDGKDCKQAARAYGYGDLVPQDLDKAKALSDKACQLGYDKCKPPLENGSWPVDAKLDDVIVDVKKWDGQFVQLRGVSAYRGSPTSGYIFAPGGKPLTDGVPTLMHEDASPDVKKAWLQMPSSRDGIPVKKVMVRVQATMVPGKARFFIVDDLQFYGTGSK